MITVIIPELDIDCSVMLNKENISLAAEEHSSAELQHWKLWYKLEQSGEILSGKLWKEATHFTSVNSSRKEVEDPMENLTDTEIEQELGMIDTAKENDAKDRVSGSTLNADGGTQVKTEFTKVTTQKLEEIQNHLIAEIKYIEEALKTRLKATSENLPIGHEDVSTFLEIADKIKSKELNPKQAAAFLKKRINNSNPNVQILALKATNKDVRDKINSLIQSWGMSFSSKPDLGYVNVVYEKMKREGMPFPPIDRSGISSFMIETATAPEWTDSNICMRCRSEFNIVNRKHHCRNCGQAFDQNCSSKSIPLPHFGITTDVRVCDGCFNKLTAKTSTISSPGSPTSIFRPTTVHANSDSFVRKEDDELQRAIMLSLEESKAYSESRKTANTYKPPEIDDDADLKAAIEESLREAERMQSKRSNSPVRSSGGADLFAGFASGNSYANAVSINVAPVDPYNYTVTIDSPLDISKSEKENLKLFAELVERMEGEVTTRGIGVFASNPQIPLLYGQISTVQQKLLGSLDETASKYRSVYELQDKLAQALKTYDHLLQERITGSYSRFPTHGRETSQPQHNLAYQIPTQPLQTNEPPKDGMYAGYNSGNSAPYSIPPHRQYANNIPSEQSLYPSQPASQLPSQPPALPQDSYQAQSYPGPNVGYQTQSVPSTSFASSPPPQSLAYPQSPNQQYSVPPLQNLSIAPQQPGYGQDPNYIYAQNTGNRSSVTSIPPPQQMPQYGQQQFGYNQPSPPKPVNDAPLRQDRSEISKLKDENNSLLAQNASLFDKVENLANEIKSIRQQAKDFANFRNLQVQQLSNKNQELGAVLPSRNDELNTTQAEVSELRAQIAQSNGELKPIDFQKVYSFFDKLIQRARELIRKSDYIVIGTIFSLTENAYVVGCQSVNNRLYSLQWATFGYQYQPKPDGKFLERMMTFNRSVMQSNVENLKQGTTVELFRLQVHVQTWETPRWICWKHARLEKYGKLDDTMREILTDVVCRFLQLGVYISLMDSPKIRVGDSKRNEFISVRDYSRLRVERAWRRNGFCDEYGLPLANCKVLPGLFALASDRAEEARRD
ncbi:Vacuolar protein-sorting-associated protein 27, partial [Nowakowskiella sp. JEL0407]